MLPWALLLLLLELTTALLVFGKIDYFYMRVLLALSLIDLY